MKQDQKSHRSAISRRRMIRLTGCAAASALVPCLSFGASKKASTGLPGAIVGEATAVKLGQEILAAGGNAVDAAVGAALAAGVAAPHQCGPGGYGAHIVIAPAHESEPTAIDANSIAPAAFREDIFPLDDQGAVVGRVNEHGWLATGVPGTLAGLQLALRRFGTKSWREVAAPAIKLAKDGFPVTAGMAGAIRNNVQHLRNDPAIARLLLKNGEPLKVGERYANPELAAMLQTLADRNSVESFYRGDIAHQIADEFQRRGGLVTFGDMVACEAREEKPLSLKWGDFTIRTGPLTAGGLTTLQALSCLKTLKWNRLAPGAEQTHARVEALRLAWRDRLHFLGDPAKVKVPVDWLLSREYAGLMADKVAAAIRAGTPLRLESAPREQGGTVNLSCVDGEGNLVALTLTHGNAFGACVAVGGLGLILGHGMSRFEPKPGHPNSPGPRKRPLHNMCPTIVMRDRRPVLALGGAGGRKIPNAIFDVLAGFAVFGQPLGEALAAPRLHTEGDLKLRFEKTWPGGEVNFLKSLGYQITVGNSARIGAASFNRYTGECQAVAR